ncbi:MAG: hypothetical protein IT225_03950 [Flavobacteriales bacterium]|jgi:hypothetical protein|nr:hypothetical protein [Flavobacteriales bacterium]
MNPIAFLAFLMGITAPTPPTKTTPPDQEQQLEKPKPGPDKGQITLKRGGWDRN